MKYTFRVKDFEGAKAVAQTLFQAHPSQDFEEAKFFTIDGDHVANFKIEGKLATLSTEDDSVNFSFSLADF
jgi:hypothetical protein